MNIEDYKAEFCKLAERLSAEHGRISSVEIEPCHIVAISGDIVGTKYNCKIDF